MQLLLAGSGSEGTLTIEWHMKLDTHLCNQDLCIKPKIVSGFDLLMCSHNFRSVVPVGQMELLPGCVGVPEDAATGSVLGSRFMALDGAALESLEVRP